MHSSTLRYRRNGQKGWSWKLLLLLLRYGQLVQLSDHCDEPLWILYPPLYPDTDVRVKGRDMGASAIALFLRDYHAMSVKVDGGGVGLRKRRLENPHTDKDCIYCETESDRHKPRIQRR
jgi:hypothetical protein